MFLKFFKENFNFPQIFPFFFRFPLFPFPRFRDGRNVITIGSIFDKAADLQ